MDDAVDRIEWDYLQATQKLARLRAAILHLADGVGPRDDITSWELHQLLEETT